MSHFDWDEEGLLNFDYGKPVPDGRESTQSQQAQNVGQQNSSSVGQSHANYSINRASVGRTREDEAQLYAEIRRKEQERALKEAQLREYMASAQRADERAQREAAERAKREAQLRAQQQAAERAQREAQFRAQQQQARERAELEAQREAQYREQQRRELAEREERRRQQMEADLRAQREARMASEAAANAERAKEEEYSRLRAAALRAQQAVAREPEAVDLRAEAQRAAYDRYRADIYNSKQNSNNHSGFRIEKSTNSDRSFSDDKNQHVSKEERKHVNQQIKEDKKALKQEKKSNQKEKKDSNKKKSNIAKNSKGAKILSAIYMVVMVIFAVAMLIMNVLPLKYLILLYGVLALLSAIIVVQLTGTRVRKWARGVAIFMSILLIFVYGVGTAYALGTLSFLGSTSVKNEDSVGKITEDPFNVVMTGIDVSGTIDEQGRSDVNMVVTINPKTATILMTSVPRDYEIRMPDKGYATDKLTHTGFYGVETTIQAEEDLFDIESNYYVKVNFSTVRNFINAIGGVDVYSEYTFNPVKRKSWTVQEGMNHMNGDEALAFARERKAFLTGDNQRIKNQQAVFEALIKKATSSKTMAISYGTILNELEDYFEMSFSSSEIRSLMKYQIAKNPDWKIYKNTVTGPGASKATYSGGSQKLYVMEQDPTSVANAKALINAVLEGKELTEDENGNVSVAAAE